MALMTKKLTKESFHDEEDSGNLEFDEKDVGREMNFQATYRRSQCGHIGTITMSSSFVHSDQG